MPDTFFLWSNSFVGLFTTHKVNWLGNLLFNNTTIMFFFSKLIKGVG